MYDLESMEKWYHLIGVAVGLNDERYDAFRDDVIKFSGGMTTLAILFDLARENKVTYYPDFSKEDREAIDLLHKKYILKIEEKSRDMENNSPIIDWDGFGQFAEIIENMSKEEFDKLCEGRNPLVEMYARAIYTGNGKPIDILNSIYLSEEDKADFKDLIASTIEKYAQKTEDKKPEGGKRGGDNMAIGKEEKLKSISEQLGVSVEEVENFVDYIKNNPELGIEIKSSFLKRNLPRETSLDGLSRLLEVAREHERTELADIIKMVDPKNRRDNMEKQEDSSTLEQRVSKRLGVSVEAFTNFSNFIMNDITKDQYWKIKAVETLPDFVRNIIERMYEDKKIPESSLEWIYPPEKKRLVKIINDLYAHQKKSVDRDNIEDEMAENIRRQIEALPISNLGEETNTSRTEEADNPFSAPSVKAKIAKLKEINGVLDKISPDKYDEVITYLKDLEKPNVKSDEKLDEKLDEKPSEEIKKSFLSRLREKKEEGRKVATDKANARDEEIKRVAAEYRKEFTEHVQANIDEVMGEDEGKIGIKQLEAQLTDLKVEKAKNEEKLEALKKEKEILEERYKDLEIETGEGKQEALSKKKLIEKGAKKAIKNSKQLIRYEKHSRLRKFLTKISQILGLVPAQEYSEEEVGELLEGNLHVEKKEESLKVETKQAEKINNIKNIRDDKLKTIDEEIQGAEALLNMAKEEIADKEAEIQKMVDGIGDDAYSRVCQELKKLEADKEYLEKLKERIANLSDREAYRLSQRGIDR